MSKLILYSCTVALLFLLLWGQFLPADLAQRLPYASDLPVGIISAVLLVMIASSYRINVLLRKSSKWKLTKPDGRPITNVWTDSAMDILYWISIAAMAVASVAIVPGMFLMVKAYLELGTPIGSPIHSAILDWANLSEPLILSWFYVWISVLLPAVAIYLIQMKMDRLRGEIPFRATTAGISVAAFISTLVTIISLIYSIPPGSIHEIYVSSRVQVAQLLLALIAAKKWFTISRDTMTTGWYPAIVGILALIAAVIAFVALTFGMFWMVLAVVILAVIVLLMVKMIGKKIISLLEFFRTIKTAKAN